MNSYLAYLSFGFIKKFDHFCDPYFIKAPDSGGRVLPLLKGQPPVSSKNLIKLLPNIKNSLLQKQMQM